MKKWAKTFNETYGYKPWIIALSVILIGAIGVLSGMRGVKDFDAFHRTILPLMNAIFNSFTFVFLVCALIAILKRNITVHRRFIYAAFVTTFLFLITYVSYHYLSTIHALRWRRLYGRILLLHSNYTYYTCSSYRPACTDECSARMEYGE